MGSIADKNPAAERATEAASERKSGRATFDDDGRASWEWQVSTGVFTRTVTEDQLMQLAESNLKLAADPPDNSTGEWVYESDRRAGRPVAPAPAGKTAAKSAPATSGPVRKLLRRLVGAS